MAKESTLPKRLWRNSFGCAGRPVLFVVIAWVVDRVATCVACQCRMFYLTLSEALHGARWRNFIAATKFEAASGVVGAWQAPSRRLRCWGLAAQLCGSR